MKTLVSCLMFAITFPLMSSADESRNVVNLPKNTRSTHPEELTGVILLPVRGIRNVEMIGEAQQKHIKKLHPDYRVVLSVYMKDKKGRYIEAVSCVNHDEEMKLVYFDVSNVYQYLKQKSEKSKLDVEKLEESYVTVQ